MLDVDDDHILTLTNINASNTESKQRNYHIFHAATTSVYARSREETQKERQQK